MSWCTQWKGTPQDCFDRIPAKHHVGDSVKMASLGKWFLSWTVRSMAHRSLALFGWRQPILPVSLSLSRFSMQNVVYGREYPLSIIA